MPEEIEFRDDPAAVYRLFDSDDTLLYVGTTVALSARMVQHAKTQPWWPQVVRKTMVWYPTRDAACEAETEAINAEHPKYNRLLCSSPGSNRRHDSADGGAEVHGQQCRRSGRVVRTVL